MMTSLTPFGPKGYVWQRSPIVPVTPAQAAHPQGRVIIVVDDFFDLPKWHRDALMPSAHAYGLPTIVDYAQRSEDVQALGFFDLPDSDQVGHSREIIGAIKAWVDSLHLANHAYYLLVDYYFGEGITKDKAFGFYFVDYWMQHPPFKAEVAHLSIGGVANHLGNPHHLKIFNRASIQDRQHLTEALLTWLGDGQHPLDQLWNSENVTAWFTDDRPVMKHDIANICEYFFGQARDAQKARRYQANVEEALGLTLPVDWWQNQTTLKHLHNSLKSLCGAYSCSQVKQGHGRRNISVGAASLIAMMAHQQIYGQIAPFATPDVWATCSQSDSPLFPVQSREIAQASTKALYDFFRCIFTPRDGRQANSLVKGVFFDNDGKKLKIQLDWQAEQRQKLSGMMMDIFHQNHVLIPPSSGNTRDAIARLWSYMTISENGFMSPGVIYMEGDEVIIASTK
jgi:hypothetical protein